MGAPLAEYEGVGTDLESEIRAIPGVVSAVVFGDRAGRPIEVQAFTFSGTSQPEVRKQIAGALTRRGHIQDTERVVVFELAGEPTRSRPGLPNVQGALTDWPQPKVSSQSSAAAPRRSKRRPRIGKISLAGNGPNAEASVQLIFNGKEAEGLGRARKTTYSLRVTAAATLEAAQALIGQPGLLALEGVSLVEVLRRRMVIVLAHSALAGGRFVVGASLVGDGPVHAAAVRASLDAVNRQLDMALSS